MKIADRINKLVEDGFITPDAVEKAREKGWITAKQKTDMVKKAEVEITKQAAKVAAVKK